MTFRTSIAILAVLTVGLAVILGLVVAWSTSDEKPGPTPAAGICLPCRQLSLHPDDDGCTLAKHFSQTGNDSGADGDSRVCCAKNDDEIKLMVKLVADRAYRLSVAKSQLEGWKLNCHLTEGTAKPKPMLKVVGKTTEQIERNVHPATVQWDETSTQSIKRGTIQYDSEEDKIVIEQSGYYYVYNQITFKQVSEGDDPDSYISSFTQSLIRDRNDYLEGLARSSQSKCDTSVTNCDMTTSIGAVFLLRKGDKVLVKTLNPDGILPSPQANYFGAFMVS